MSTKTKMWDRIIGLFLLVAMSFAVCCTGEGNYSLDVNFPDDESLASTSVLVVWVLDETPGACNKILSREIDPDDENWHARLEIEAQSGKADGLVVLPGVPNGDLIFAAEGSTSSGARILYGCQAAKIKPDTTVKAVVDLVCVCEPVQGTCAPVDEIMHNDVDDDCDGKTDECDSELDCDDKNGCTQDFCVFEQCQHPHWPDTTQCDDMNPCTSNDACLDGVCAGIGRDCSSLDGVCIRGVCNRQSGECELMQEEDLSPCEDGLFCTVDDYCQSGVCVEGGWRDCEDDELCTRDICIENERACRHIWGHKPSAEGLADEISCADGEDNDCDGLVDTEDPDCLVCETDGDCSDDNPCTLKSCEDGVCLTSVTNESGSCEDDLFCTEGEVCVDGACRGNWRECVASDTCHLSVCLEDIGLCGEQQKEDGETCDDGLFCTVQDNCQAGICQGAERTCEDGDICTLDACDEGLKECTHDHQEIPGAEGPAGEATCGNDIDDDCDGKTDDFDEDCGGECSGIGGPDGSCRCEGGIWWELDFETDPAAMDVNSDGIADWHMRDGSLFDVSELVDGAWHTTSDAALDSAPECNFDVSTSVHVRFRNTSVGGRGAVFWINTDFETDSSTSISAMVALRSGGGQVLTIYSQDDDGDVELAQFTGLPESFIDLWLSIDVEADTVAVWVQDEFSGTYDYTTHIKRDDRFASMLSWGSDAEFDFVRIESCPDGAAVPQR